MIYRCGRDLTAPSGGEYAPRVHVDPPTFMRHDEANGKRFLEPVPLHRRTQSGRRRGLRPTLVSVLADRDA
jgi:hypothetical protein